MNLTNFLTYIKQDFKRTDKDTEITQAINDMIVWISIQIPHAGYKYQSYIPTVAKQYDYPLPTTKVHILHPLMLLDGFGTNDLGMVLEHIGKKEFDLIEPNPQRTNPSTAKTQKYTIFANSILCTPIPDKVYILQMDWTKRAVSLSGGSDAPALGSEWDEVIKHGSLERLFAGIGLYEEANYWSTRYKDQEGNPIGMCKKLLDMEEDREGSWVSDIQNNSL